jgi:hypothetical protein
MLAQFRQVAGGELLQLRLTAWSELHQHLPPVGWRSRAQNQTAVHQPDPAPPAAAGADAARVLSLVRPVR